MYFFNPAWKCLTISLALLKGKTGSRVFSNSGVLDRLVPPTRTATTAGGGFPTQSQRRWWQLWEWRYYVCPDKDGKPAAKTTAVGLLLFSPQLQQRAVSRGEREATSGGGKRTHHSQSAQCCVCWTHACQRKLVLSRPKELAEIRR